MRKILRIGAGIGLVLIGIVGLIMPIMPGWVFIIPGLIILGEYSPPIQRLVHWLKEKFESARAAASDKPSATMEDRPGK